MEVMPIKIAIGLERSTNGRLRKNMPLLSEVADYDDWRGRYHEMGNDVVYPP